MAYEPTPEHIEDITRIGERLIELADEYGWCSTYDRNVDDLNEYLHVPLPPRHKDYTVTVEVTLVEQHTFTALDEDSAAEQLKQEILSEYRHVFNNFANWEIEVINVVPTDH